MFSYFIANSYSIFKSSFQLWNISVSRLPLKSQRLRLSAAQTELLIIRSVLGFYGGGWPPVIGPRCRCSGCVWWLISVSSLHCGASMCTKTRNAMKVCFSKWKKKKRIPTLALFDSHSSVFSRAQPNQCNRPQWYFSCRKCIFHGNCKDMVQK